MFHPCFSTLRQELGLWLFKDTTKSISVIYQRSVLTVVTVERNILAICFMIYIVMDL